MSVNVLTDKEELFFLSKQCFLKGLTEYFFKYSNNVEVLLNLYVNNCELLKKTNLNFIKDLLQINIEGSLQHQEFAAVIYDDAKDILLQDIKFIKNLILSTCSEDGVNLFSQEVYEYSKYDLIYDNDFVKKLIKKNIAGGLLQKFFVADIFKDISASKMEFLVKSDFAFFMQILDDLSFPYLLKTTAPAIFEVFENHIPYVLKHISPQQAGILFRLLSHNYEQLQESLYKKYGNEILIYESPNSTYNKCAMIYLNGPDYNGAFGELDHIINGIATDNLSGLNTIIASLNNRYLNSDNLWVKLANIAENSDHTTIIMGMHGFWRHDTHEVCFYGLSDENCASLINTRDVVKQLIQIIGADKAVDIILMSCKGALAIYDIYDDLQNEILVLPDNFSFISVSDTDSSSQFIETILKKIAQNPRDDNYTLNHLLKIGLCTSSSYLGSSGSKDDMTHPIRILKSGWEQILELHEEAEYIKNNYAKIFTQEVISQLQSNFMEIEGTCGGYESVHNKIDSIINKIACNTLLPQDYYGLLSITHEILNIYHELDKDLYID